MVTRITLISDKENPLLLQFDKLQNEPSEIKITEKQIRGSIRDKRHNTMEPTRWQKDKLNVVIPRENELHRVELELWVYDTDLDRQTDNLVRYFHDIVEDQVGYVLNWKEIHNERVKLIKKELPNG